MNTVLHPKRHFLQPLSPGWLAAASLGMAALGGCGLPAEPAPSGPAPGVARQKIIEDQGMSLQGMNLQGMSLQGISLQGISLQGMSLQGMSLQGISLQGTSLQGVPLASTLDVASDPQTVSLRIEQVEADPQDAAGETQLYTVNAWNTESQTWQNLCNATQSGEQKAIVVSGYWDQTGAHIEDPTRFTFACTSGVIAKCVRWGYKPWKTVNGQSLSPYHQACTRMARADYCGTGHSYTRDGTWIDLYDKLLLQLPTQDSGMTFEGAWTPHGAYCISKLRWNGKLPSGEWLAGLLLSDCGLSNIRFLYENLGQGDQCYFGRKGVSAADVLISNRSFMNSSYSTTQ